MAEEAEQDLFLITQEKTLQAWREHTFPFIIRLPDTLFSEEEAIKCATSLLALLRFPVSGSPLEADEALDACAVQWNALPLEWQRRLSLFNSLKAHWVITWVQKQTDMDPLLYSSRILGQFETKLVHLRIEELGREISKQNNEALVTQTLVERFLAHSSHEIRTPLTAILGFSELLLEGSYGETTEAQYTALGHIHNSAQNLTEIVNNLIDILRIRSGKLIPTPRLFAVAPFLERLHTLLQPLAQRKQVIFQLDTPATLGNFYADEQMLNHILYPLLTSCIRATPGHGSVRLYAQATPDTLCFEVSDSALHLSSDALAHIQSHLPRLENSPTRGYEDWEIGLPLVRRYVDLHGGSLEIESLHQQGTRFLISIPAPRIDKGGSKGSQ